MNYISRSGHAAWVIGSEFPSEGELRGLSPAIDQDVKGVVACFGRLSANDLVEYVYRRHIDFTVNSLRERLADRKKCKTAVYTSGYEGRSVDAFLNLLVQYGIERIIDVRSNPIARRFGFHKSTLDRLAGRLSVSYVHFPELGIESKIRQLSPASRPRHTMFDDYEFTRLAGEHAAVMSVCELIRQRPSVLVCMEADPACCHRSRLAKLVSKMTDLEIQHLGCDR